jgi:O-antigen/teichoic acid export membrane protein
MFSAGMTRLLQFASGKVVSILVNFAFQVYLIRTMSGDDYNRYAVGLSLALLLELLFNLGIGNMAYVRLPTLLSGGDPSQFMRSMIRYRVLSIVVLGLACLGIAIFGGSAQLATDAALIFVLSASILLVSDFEAVSQIQNLQKRTAIIPVLESITRFALVALLAHVSDPSYAAVLFAYATTQAASAAALIAINLRAASAIAPVQTREVSVIDWRLARFGLETQFSAVGTAMMSSPVLRMLGGFMLPSQQFTTFAFCHTICSGLAKFSVGLLLSPFLQSVGARARLQADGPRQVASALSPVVKIDTVLYISLIVASLAAGGAVLQILSKNRIEDSAIVLTAVLALSLLWSTFRTLEIANACLGETRGLRLILPAGLLSLGATYGVAMVAPLASLLVWPLIDGMVKIAILQSTLLKQGAVLGLSKPIVAFLASSAAWTAMLLVPLQGHLPPLALATAGGLGVLAIALATVMPPTLIKSLLKR